MSVTNIIKGIVICRELGDFLVDLIVDEKINSILLSSFISAISILGKENMGKITDISIKGLDVDIVVAYKYDLILIAFLSKGYATYGLRDKTEEALEMFYSTYHSEIDSKKLIDINEFDDFKKILFLQLKKYLESINQNQNIDEYEEFSLLNDDFDEKKLGRILSVLDNIEDDQIEYDVVSKFLKGLVICKESGDYLADLILSPKFNPILLSKFVAAFSMIRSKELGKIEEISIVGLEVDMVIIYKYNLILIAVLEKDFFKYNIREEFELFLDAFFSSFQDEIENNKDFTRFVEFKGLFLCQLIDYFKNLKTLFKT